MVDMQRLNARWLGLLAVTLIALYLCWLIISPFINVILWAAVLAVIAYPYHIQLCHRGFKPWLSALICTIGVILVVLVPVIVILTLMAAQVPEAVKQVNALGETAKHWINPESKLYQWVDPYVDLDWLQDPEVIREKTKAWLSPLTAQTASWATAAVTGVAGTLIQICFALFTLFYFLRDTGEIRSSMIDLLPLERQQSLEVFKRCREIIQASVQGVILIAAIQGVLGALGFWFLGIPSAVLWGVVMFLLSLVPALGAFLVWVPAAIFLFATGHPYKAILLMVWGGVVIGSVDNFLRPRLVGKKTGMHDLVIFFSVLGGLQVFGVLGLFIGPVVVAISLSIIEVFKQASQSINDSDRVTHPDTPTG
ncbi:MAG: AI-2E family transporter [Phycisphaerae bacterium]|jgi:predicted PurR-regulated permease PerM|nr:MAG: AI-2E family transporter [Phycisphaerae bacterium]